MPKKPVRLPFVSVCTPTYNRRIFIPTLFECFRNQNYPKELIEWIVVDDGTDKIQDLVENSGIKQIKYYSVDRRMLIGAKRNYTHSLCKGSIIVYMDDDDYYPPERISHAVERLMSSPTALCAGSSKIYIYYNDLGKMYQFGPYGPNHATAGTFAFKKELLKHTQYDENAVFAEERVFLKDYTVPFVQLDPLKTILVFAHPYNTIDKHIFIEKPNDYVQESCKTVDSFIRSIYETEIKAFFSGSLT